MAATALVAAALEDEGEEEENEKGQGAEALSSEEKGSDGQWALQ